MKSGPHWRSTSSAVGDDPRMAPAMQAGLGRIINLASQQILPGIQQQWHLRCVQGRHRGADTVNCGALRSLRVTCNTLVPGFVVTPLTEQAVQHP